MRVGLPWTPPAAYERKAGIEDMKRTDIEKAVEIAAEFIVRADTLIFKVSQSQSNNWKKDWSLWGCKETAALRRASMDLTRALAEMRKT